MQPRACEALSCDLPQKLDSLTGFEDQSTVLCSFSFNRCTDQLNQIQKQYFNIDPYNIIGPCVGNGPGIFLSAPASWLNSAPRQCSDRRSLSR